MIEVRLLEHALAVADQGSFALAAQALGISQSALSRSIQSLESQLETQLFDRSRRRVEPTDAGQIFLERARDIVARHQEFSREMGQLPQRERPIFTLAVGPYVAESIGAAAVARIIEVQPGVQYNLRVENWASAVKLVRWREADMAVAESSQLADDPELSLTPLEKLQGYFVVRAKHPLLRQQSLDVSRVLSYPLVATSRLPPRIRAPLQSERGEGPAGGLLAFPSVLCEQTSVMRALVARSNAVGMFYLSLIEKELADGSLVPLACDAPWLHTEFGVVRHRHRPLAAHGEQLAQFILDTAADLYKKERMLARALRSSDG